VKLVGTRSNRDGIGARVSVAGANGFKTWNMVRTGSSYASQSELTLTFGLGKPDGTDRAFTVEVDWPSGERMALPQVKANQSLVIEEGRGVAKSDPVVFARPAASPTPTPTPQAPQAQ
jgi:hypothetical protein